MSGNLNCFGNPAALNPQLTSPPAHLGTGSSR